MTPAPIADEHDREIRKVLADPEVRGRMESMGFVDLPASRAALRTFIANEREKWRGVIVGAGIKVE